MQNILKKVVKKFGSNKEKVVSLYQAITLITLKQNKMIVGSKVIYGCDIAEVCSVIVNDIVMIKIEHNDKIESVHIDNIELI